MEILSKNNVISRYLYLSKEFKNHTKTSAFTMITTEPLHNTNQIVKTESVFYVDAVLVFHHFRVYLHDVKEKIDYWLMTIPAKQIRSNRKQAIGV